MSRQPSRFGRDTRGTIRAWDRIAEQIKPAPRLFRGPIPDRSLDLAPFRLPRYRGQLIGCCVGESGAAMGETTARTPTPLDERSVPNEGTPALSPLWVYYIARKRTAQQSGRMGGEGAIVSDALLAVIDEGYIDFDAWPANEDTYRRYSDRRPHPGAVDAPRHKPIAEAKRLTDPDQVLEYLAGGYSVWIGIPWRGGDTSSDGTFRWGGRAVGGHAVELLGYDKPADRITIGNSWDNARWGIQPGGYGYTSLTDLMGELSERALNSGRSEACVVTEIEGEWGVKLRDWSEVL